MKVDWWWLVVVAAIVYWWTNKRDQAGAAESLRLYKAAVAAGLDVKKDDGSTPAHASASAINPQGASAFQAD